MIDPGPVWSRTSDKKGPSPVESLEILANDETGEKIVYPVLVYFDKNSEETFVLSGGVNSHIIVFDRDYYPFISLGSKRGVNSPRGIFIDEKGNLYICQIGKDGIPPRISIYNGAFFPVGEILFDQIPGVRAFSPRRLVRSRSGNYYVIGEKTRGVLVLDPQARFLRWITPMEKVVVEKKQSDLPLELQLQKEQEGAGNPFIDDSPADDEPLVDEPDEELEEDEEKEFSPVDFLGNPDLVPKARSSDLFTPQKTEQVPVALSDINIDQSGNIYLLSEQRGKIYVYSFDERFLFSFGTKGGSVGKLSRPRGFGLDEARGFVYVVDYMRHTILAYSMRSGRFLFEFGGRGTGATWFNFPMDIAVDNNGNVIVSDLFNHRVQVLDVNAESRLPIFEQMPDQLAVGSLPMAGGDRVLSALAGTVAGGGKGVTVDLFSLPSGQEVAVGIEAAKEFFNPRERSITFPEELKLKRVKE
ncbi:NHL repeat-containing protein [Thermodesulfobacteriota bacterium]